MEDEYDYPDSGYPLTDGDALSEEDTSERPEYGEESAKAAKIFPYDDPPETPSQNELLFKAFHYK